MVGYLLARSGVLGPAAVQVLSRVAFFVASPALLFVTLAHADVGAVFSDALVVTAVSSSVACLLYLPVGLLRRRPPGETAVGAMASGYVNAGNLGIPIATYALGNAAEVAPVMLFQLTVLAPVFSTVLDLLAARTDGERPPLLRTLTAPAAQPDRDRQRGRPGRLGDGPAAARRAARAGRARSATWRCPRCCWRSGCRCGARRGRAQATARRPSSPCCCSRTSCSPRWRSRSASLLGLEGHALLAVVVCAALPTAQNVFGYAVRFGQGVTLGRDAGLATTLVSVPVLFTVVALLD